MKVKINYINTFLLYDLLSSIILEQTKQTKYKIQIQKWI